MIIEINKELTNGEMFVRKMVFTLEQGLVDEPDEIDKKAVHLVLKNDDGICIGVCRVFKDEDDNYVFGRLAVLKEYRGKGYGKLLLSMAEKYVKDNDGDRLLLHSQLDAKDFYSSNGYIQKGMPDTVQGCVHVWMQKKL